MSRGSRSGFYAYMLACRPRGFNNERYPRFHVRGRPNPRRVSRLSNIFTLEKNLPGAMYTRQIRQILFSISLSFTVLLSAGIGTLQPTLCPYAGAPRAVLGAQKEGEVVDLNVTTAIPWGRRSAIMISGSGSVIFETP